MNLEDDIELKDLAQTIGKWLIVVLIFGGMFTFILVKRFGSQEIAVNKKIDSKETVIVFITTSKNETNRAIKEILDSYDIKYTTVYKDKERYFEDFLIKTKQYEEDVKEPAIVYIEKGNVIDVIKEINNSNDLIQFIEYNNLTGKGR